MPKTPEEIAAEEAAATAAEETASENGELPADHPLVKTLAAQKELIKELRALTGAPGDLAKIREKAKKFDDAEEANKSELDKALARAEAAEKIVADQKAKDDAATLREEVAKAKKFEERKVPASALRGSTREELEAHADEILALLPAPAETPSADGQGGTGTPIGDGDMSADDIVAAATAR